jgi:hypothetical protein
MKYAKLWSAVMCAVLVPMFASQQASAGELSSCTSNCACTAETSLGYDSCTTISESELVDVSDPLALRQALGLTTVYNANTRVVGQTFRSKM